MTEFLVIDIKTLDDGGFHFYQNGFIRKVLEATGMDHYNGFPTPTKVEAPLGTYYNSSEAKRDWPNPYASFIGMMLYMAPNTIPDISFSVQQYDWFTHNTKASYETAVKRIFCYLQCTNDNGILFNPSQKLVVDCYDDADFARLWGHENPQDPIFDRSRT